MIRALLLMCVSLATLPAGAGQPRLVSVGGALTETVYALGAGASLAGIDSTSTPAPAAPRPVNVGYARALSVEGVLSLAPDRVIATEDAGPPATLAQLRGAGVAVTILPGGHRFEGVVERIRRIGEITGRQSAAGRLSAELTRQWAQVRAQVARRQGPMPRTLFILSHAPNQLLAAGRGTAADAMLGFAGARNIMDALNGYQPLTPEAVASAAPEVIVMTQQGLRSLGGEDALWRRMGLGRTPAGRARRLVTLEEMFLLGFGPRMPDAVAALDLALRRAMKS